MNGTFQVIAGKYDHNQERDVKVVSEPWPTLDAAMADAKTCAGYHFIDIEYTALNGEVFLITVEKVAQSS